VRLRVANAPVSYGAFEWTVGIVPNVPDPEQVLEAMAAAGYEGSELGPPGYLGDGRELAERLDRLGLALVGGYVPLELTDASGMVEGMRELEGTLELFLAAAGTAPVPVLADAGSEPRLARPGQSARDPDLRVPEADWRRLVDNLRRAVDACRTRGFEPTFHQHAGTYVETSAEVERLLDACDVGLLVDTGHMAMCGIDPVAALDRWGERVTVVHLKDLNGRVFAGAGERGWGLEEATRHGVFCELGEGDVDLREFLHRLADSRYEGWLVVEQDRIPAPDEHLAPAIEAQRANRRWLREEAGL
jgi:inosose dehydratase